MTHTDLICRPLGRQRPAEHTRGPKGHINTRILEAILVYGISLVLILKLRDAGSLPCVYVVFWPLLTFSLLPSCPHNLRI